MINESQLLIERVQTGVRMEKRLLKVLKAFAEYHDMSLGDLLEGIVLHAFDGKTPFSPASLERIRELRKFYELDLDSSASHRLKAAMTWAGFGGVILDLVSPWLITYVSPVFVLTMLTGDTLMMVSFLVMMAVPLYEMWVLKQPLMAGKQPEDA
jgi:hypothetical protein